MSRKVIVETHSDTFTFDSAEEVGYKVEVDEDGRLHLLDDANELIGLFNKDQWVGLYYTQDNE